MSEITYNPVSTDRSSQESQGSFKFGLGFLPSANNPQVTPIPVYKTTILHSTYHNPKRPLGLNWHSFTVCFSYKTTWIVSAFQSWNVAINGSVEVALHLSVLVTHGVLSLGFASSFFWEMLNITKEKRLFWSLLCLYFKDYDSMMRWFGKGFKNSTQTNSTHSLSKQLLFHFEAIVY